MVWKSIEVSLIAQSTQRGTVWDASIKQVLQLDNSSYTYIYICNIDEIMEREFLIIGKLSTE